jgi:small conductance mechanosensitive channel
MTDSRHNWKFDTHSHQWHAAGLAPEVGTSNVRRAWVRAALLFLMLIGVLVVYGLRSTLFAKSAQVPLRVAAVAGVLLFGWGVARNVGRAAGPTFFRRLDPAAAGTIGFLVRLATIVAVLLVALQIAAVSPQAVLTGTAVTAVVIGLAAQQTLGNLFAGLVLVSVRPFRVGQRVRMQAGVLAGELEGVVSSQGLLYMTLASGADRIMIPNSVALSASIRPVREPKAVDLEVRVDASLRPTDIQALLDRSIETSMRDPATVSVTRLDGDDLIVHVTATPESAADGGRLADEVIAALAAFPSAASHATPSWSPSSRSGSLLGPPSETK